MTKHYEYIFRHYGVRPQVGRSIEHGATNRKGRILPEAAGAPGFVRVKLEGEKRSRVCHPLELTFLDAPQDMPHLSGGRS